MEGPGAQEAEPQPVPPGWWGRERPTGSLVVEWEILRLVVTNLRMSIELPSCGSRINCWQPLLQGA